MEQSVELPVPQVAEQLVDVPKIVVELTVSFGEAGSSGPGGRDTTDAAATAVKVLVGKARPLGISQYSTAPESEVEGSPGEAGSSWRGADDTTRPDDATVAEPVGEARPPGIAEHSVPGDRVQQRTPIKLRMRLNLPRRPSRQ